ncbi:MAG TPA: subclass B3 metallo-beta-lactamase [Phenylobacterium sp.]|nr:subclass B3 metallo-beta-lactamase [Phenylobacterium sp.]
MALVAGPASAQNWPAEWTRPVAPYRVVGSVYYVGSEGLSAFLIAGSKGHILLDGGMPDGGAALIEANIRKLGFRLEDVKILINTHAHIDHAGGLAQLKADTKAKLYASKGDEWSLEHGQHFGDNENGPTPYPAVKVDRTIRDGRAIKLGENAITPILTPGHTAGCTTWSLPVVERDRPLNVVFYCSTTVAGNRLVGNQAYPKIVADYRASFAKLKTLPADVFLPNHPQFADLAGKRRRVAQGGPNPFVDPDEMRRFVEASEEAFEAELAKQEAGR